MPNIIAESLRSVTQILAIFSGSFFKSAAVYFHKKTIFWQSFTLISIFSLVKIGIYKQIGVIDLAKSKKSHLSDIFPAKCLAKNFTLFRISAIVIRDLLKDLHKRVSWTAK